VTLIEMLVTVAILVIVMTILVQVFQAATGVLSAAQTIQDLDNQLKLLDSTIRADLSGVTARFTPPLDPTQNLGYFEYGENEFADVQGEDSDDYLRFTAKAPAGQPFTGRIWVSSSGPGAMNNLATISSPLPVTVTSDYAEIIYFLRNGNLYRRVLLVAPELQAAIMPAINNVGYYVNAAGTPTPLAFTPTFLGALPVSWQGVNDLSARPAAVGPNTNVVTAGAGNTAGDLTQAQQGLILNTLGDLTNRENRAFSPRFCKDFLNILAAAGAAPSPDGYDDDVNLDKVQDLYPTFYVRPTNVTPPLDGIFSPFINATGGTSQLLFPPPLSPANPTVGLLQLEANPGAPLLAFPYVFPGAYSNPQQLTATGTSYRFGWIHSPSPMALDFAGKTHQFETDTLNYLNFMNHNPLDLGDNLPTPAVLTGKPFVPTTDWQQSWWGFPTWRETLSQNWNDPTRQLNDNVNFTNFGQPNGLIPRPSLTPPGGPPPPIVNDGQDLPWMGEPVTVAKGGVFPNNYDFSIIRRNPQLFSDAQASKLFMSVFLQAPGGGVDPVWTVSWEDDLIMTGVRSFDVKAYDNTFGGYADLGWGDDLRLYLPYSALAGYAFSGNTPPVPTAPPPYLTTTPPTTTWPPVLIGSVTADTLTQTLAHEGRMPPVIADNRLDAQLPNPTYNFLTGAFTPQYPLFPAYSSNIGDDRPAIVRLRRVWDSWSLEYSNAPQTGLNHLTGFLAGPVNGSPPIYPSYPPPYPCPLRGIQIQIRVADPTNQRVKSLTIRQDFTDKL
jgi:hypothetical protein